MKIRDASEEPIDVSILEQMVDARHHGWRWKGSEDCNVCILAPCGLVVVPDPDCPQHRHSKIGAAKQVHWARECPGVPIKD